MSFDNWSTTAALNVLATTGVNADEGQTPSSVNDGIRELMAQLKAAIASQAEQETATSLVRFVTPGRQGYHPSAAKGWVKCGVTGNVLASMNVTSVTDVGTGQITINWTAPFSSADYCTVAQPLSIPAGTAASTHTVHVTAQAVGTTSCTNIRMSDFAAADPANWCVVAFGDL
jgi:hypothetical protein